MKSYVTLQLDDDKIRFTPDGRIAVVDAIGALSDAECPTCIWEALKRNNPQLIGLCADYSFREKENVVVADSESWMIIQTLLLDQLIDGDIT